MPARSYASYAYVVGVAAGSSDTTAVTTGAVTTTGSNLGFIFISDYAAGGSPSCVPTDSKSNSWTALTPQSSGVLTRIAGYYAYAPTVGTLHTFTATCNAGQYPGVIAIFFSGAKASPLDQQNGATTTGATTLSTGSVTPSENNELVISGISEVSAAPAINSGFTLNSSETLAYSGTFLGAAVAFKIQVALAAVNPQWSNLTGSDAAASIETFKATAPSCNGGLLLVGIGGC